MEKIGIIQVELYSHTLGCGCHQNVYRIPGYANSGRDIEVRIWRACDEEHGHNFDRQPQAKWLQS